MRICVHECQTVDDVCDLVQDLREEEEGSSRQIVIGLMCLPSAAADSMAEKLAELLARRALTAEIRRECECRDPHAVNIAMTEDSEYLNLQLGDGREFYVPLKWYPGLRLAPRSARRNFVNWSGIGVEWPDISRDLSVRGMVADCIERGVEPTYWRTKTK